MKKINLSIAVGTICGLIATQLYAGFVEIDRDGQALAFPIEATQFASTSSKSSDYIIKPSSYSIPNVQAINKSNKKSPPTLNEVVKSNQELRAELVSLRQQVADMNTEMTYFREKQFQTEQTLIAMQSNKRKSSSMEFTALNITRPN